MIITIVTVEYPTSYSRETCTFYFQADEEGLLFCQQLPAGVTVVSYKSDRTISVGASLAALAGMSSNG